MNSIRNKVTLIGHLGEDPQVKTHNDGLKELVVALATMEKFNNGREKVAETMWHRLKHAAGVPDLQFRDLRRSAATNADSLEAARALLGHTSSVITRRVYMRRERVKPTE